MNSKIAHVIRSVRREKKSKEWAQRKREIVLKSLGPDPLAQNVGFLNVKKPKNNEVLYEPLFDEIEANCRALWKKASKGILILVEQREENQRTDLEAATRDDDAMSIIQIEDEVEMGAQIVENLQLGRVVEGNDIIENILPLNSDENENGIATVNEIPS